MGNMRTMNWSGWTARAVICLCLGWGCLCRAEDPEAAPATNAVETADGEVLDEPTDDRRSAYSDMELLTEVLMHVRKHYVSEKTFQEITYGALHGMLESLDPHSDFLEPAAFEDIRNGTAGVYGGIGIHVGLRDSLLTVIAPIEGTPGFRAGLQSGDRIVEIDGVKSIGMTLRRAVELMRGPEGESVALSIHRPDTNEALELEIVREVIEVSSVKGVQILRDDIGYLRITQFANPTAGAVQSAVTNLLGQGMEALVLDLRGNPGGLLRSATEIAQKFLPEGEPIVSTRGREGSGTTGSVAEGEHHYIDFPMVVLVNRGSASASEIVAGALQDDRRAILIGETTFGKASVQSVIRMKSDPEAAIRLTTAHYYTPSGRSIHGTGIDPDIEVPVSPSEWRRVQEKRTFDENPGFFSEEQKKRVDHDAVDVALQRALDLLKAVRIYDRQK